MQPTAPSVAPPTAAPSGGFQNLGWYPGQGGGSFQYYNGTWGSNGSINPNSPQQGAGQKVSNAVVSQTNPNNVQYLANSTNATPPGGTASGIPTVGNILNGSQGLALAQPSVPNLSGLYDQYYTNNPNAVAANKSITDLQGQITTRQQARDQATKDINDNPFFAEATRVGKINQLNSEAENDINTINNQLTTAQTSVTNLQAEAERRVNLAQGQYTLENEAWKQNLDEFNTLISQGALTNVSPATLSGLSVATGIPTDMLSSIVSSENAKNTQLITSTDKSGNVTVSAVNAQTGTVKTIPLGQVGSGSGSGGKTLTKSQETEATYQNLLTDVQNGITLKSLIDHYAIPGSGVTEQMVYQTYADLSPFGAPKETQTQVKSGQYADMPGFVSTK